MIETSADGSTDGGSPGRNDGSAVNGSPGRNDGSAVNGSLGRNDGSAKGEAPERAFNSALSALAASRRGYLARGALAVYTSDGNHWPIRDEFFFRSGIAMSTHSR